MAWRAVLGAVSASVPPSTKILQRARNDWADRPHDRSGIDVGRPTGRGDNSLDAPSHSLEIARGGALRPLPVAPDGGNGSAITSFSEHGHAFVLRSPIAGDSFVSRSRFGRVPAPQDRGGSASTVGF